MEGCPPDLAILVPSHAPVPFSFGNPPKTKAQDRAACRTVNDRTLQDSGFMQLPEDQPAPLQALINQSNHVISWVHDDAHFRSHHKNLAITLSPWSQAAESSLTSTCVTPAPNWAQTGGYSIQRSQLIATFHLHLISWDTKTRNPEYSFPSYCVLFL